MQVELSALEKISTWKLMDLPPNVKSIGCLRSNTTLMEQLKDSKLGWLSKGTTKLKGLIILKHTFML